MAKETQPYENTINNRWTTRGPLYGWMRQRLKTACRRYTIGQGR
jgi:hypothetical protein